MIMEILLQGTIQKRFPCEAPYREETENIDLRVSVPPEVELLLKALRALAQTALRDMDKGQ